MLDKRKGAGMDTGNAEKMKELMPGVVCIEFKPVNSGDSRGPTWQWYGFSACQVVICHRRAGSISCHVHTGEDPSKNPENIFFALGRGVLTFKDPVSEVQVCYNFRPGSAFIISPKIVHKTDIHEDAVILEARATPFNPKKSDTYPARI
jgi:hypothetical protein